MFQNKYAAATTQLQDLIRAHPQDAKDHATYALVLNYQTKQKPALDEALKAQQLAPNDGFVLTVLTRVEDWNNDLQSAARDGAAAIKASPSSALARAFYGEALADVCGFYVDYRTRTHRDPDAPRVPKTRNWPQLIAITTTDDIANHAGAQLLDGPRIDARAVETLSCTAQLLRLVLDEHGAIRSYQLLPSSVTDALFGAVAARDQGCRWPGCHKQPIHCDLHHVHHRAKGGKNSTCNCCLFCKYHHHRAAHDTTITLHMARDGTLTITYTDGTTETTIPPPRQPRLPQ